ncbi:alpha-L-fucosidase [Maribacter litopenaei]|uniref:Alpha-L-fucosidase n=1 Tax=Maribacter litopenaei TaxID=2976127 RepID=A0ABY5Y7Z7_9FLAO|nr:alpha-L-fucosidase [Maribacter litopenaei]UWX54600.1 alpha-L-fucosidase [Maribacter litopenaei]
MTGKEGVQMLVDIVAKGGNLLLNIAPSPKGNGTKVPIICYRNMGSGWI